MSENITLEVISESVFLTQVLPPPLTLEITGGERITKTNITNALGYVPVSPDEAIAYAIAL
jgi:hypothetical protein